MLRSVTRVTPQPSRWIGPAVEAQGLRPWRRPETGMQSCDLRIESVLANGHLTNRVHGQLNALLDPAGALEGRAELWSRANGLIRDNSAPTGANVQPEGGALYYSLPTPPGYWLPNSDCVANRQPCGQSMLATPWRLRLPRRLWC